MIVSAPAARAAMTLARPRWPGPRISTVSPGPVSGISTAQRKPAPSGLNITASAGREIVADRVHDRVRIEVHVVGVRAPQPGRVARAARRRGRTCRRGRDTPGSARRDRRGSGRSGISASTATRSPTFDPPALRGAVADALDDAERLVPGNQRHAHRDDAGVLLDVAAADAARLDAQQRAVVVDVGDRQLAQLELARPGLHDGAGRSGRHAGRGVACAVGTRHAVSGGRGQPGPPLPGRGRRPAHPGHSACRVPTASREDIT